MALYRFRQKNSGGFFAPPAMTVYIEADNVDEANELALQHGIYFDGCDTGRDCRCCGDRWNPTSSNNGYSEVDDYDKKDELGLAKDDGVPTYIVFNKEVKI